jgi:glycosyltransferase involved in cell wall biosynthesis
VASLERAVRRNADIDLAIAFEMTTDVTKDIVDGVTYYPINVDSTSKRMNDRITMRHEEKLLLPRCLDIINDFRPDIIQCFGSEWCFGLVANYVDIPVVVHMQGSMPSYYNALYPPRYSAWSEARYYLSRLNLRKTFHALIEPSKNRQRTEREIRVFEAVRHYMGRTRWDRAIVDLFAPGSDYFTCNEALRQSFYDIDHTWEPKSRSVMKLVTVGNGTLWKGMDVLIKTANALTRFTDINFEWRVIGGVHNRRYIEAREGMTYEECNVTFTGVLDETRLAYELLDADIYIHPSYIDNSPNSLCEAMILGLPCIATAVGGVPDMIHDGIDGLLVPPNEPYMLADAIKNLYENPEKMQRLGHAARQRALKRHDPELIVHQLMSAYHTILYPQEVPDAYAY